MIHNPYASPNTLEATRSIDTDIQRYRIIPFPHLAWAPTLFALILFFININCSLPEFILFCSWASSALLFLIGISFTIKTFIDLPHLKNGGRHVVIGALSQLITPLWIYFKFFWP